MLRRHRLLGVQLRPSRLVNASSSVRRRWATTDALTPQDASTSLPSQSPESEGWLFVDSVLPIMLGSWDFRHYVAYLREDYLLSRIETLFESVKTSGFRVLSVESRTKDGGVFVKFNYKPGEDKDTALHNILSTLQEETEERGGIPTWLGVRPQAGHIWLVKGKPWREDLNRFSSPMLKVAFDGPDIREDDLYNILRPYGRIMEITNPVPVPSGSLRSVTVTFRQLRSSVTAHNCIHSLSVPSTGPNNTRTRLHTTFERPIKAHVIRDWMSGHPRIVIPIVVFLLGSLTYTIFDPIRAFAVEGKLSDWFDYRKSNVYKWVRENTWERFSFGSKSGGSLSSQGVWRDRRDAEAGIETYLRDYPGTLTFVHGPQGSGKSRMLSSVLKDNERPVLVIDCAELYKASSESAMLLSLARQTGYWPIFPFVNSLNNLIDVASMGLIGQKAGLSSSLENQVKEMLEVVGTGLRNVSSRQTKKLEKIAQESEECDRARAFHSQREAAIRLGIWHDGRLDCVAGNGVMCELGIGDEYMGELDYDPVHSPDSTFEKLAFADAGEGKGRENTVIKGSTSVETLPIVIIKNFATKRGRDEVLTVMANWAASLVNNQVAHVIVVSDNRENAKVLAQALPSKPLNSIPLDDADSAGALSFVSEKLREGGDTKELSPELTKYIERLGGRASDLETMVHKVLNGETVEGAIEEIITRGVNELRKNGFGDDIEDAKSLSWTREQAWTIVKLLSKEDEVPYHDVLLDFPFKGDENALRNMEHAEIISIGTNQGRPSIIKPGRPIYRYVFERLVADPIFRAISEIAVHEKLIASAESTIRACEDELSKLKELGGVENAHWWSSSNGMNARSTYLIKKMDAAVDKLIKLEAKNAELKKVLAKGD